MKVSIQREELVTYEVPEVQGATLLEVLQHIKTNVDNTLTFSSGCRSSVCGSCAMRVNGKEVLACAYKVQDGDAIAPLKNVPVLRDLVVDMHKAYSFNAKAKAYQSSEVFGKALTIENEKINEIQSDCIMCGSCYSACPVYEAKPEFMGPFSLTRLWRYVSDVREEDVSGKIANAQSDGVWDCTLCNECTIVCPQDISSKADIEKLRARSTMLGHTDPNFANFGGGFGGMNFDGSPSF